MGRKREARFKLAAEERAVQLPRIVFCARFGDSCGRGVELMNQHIQIESN